MSSKLVFAKSVHGWMCLLHVVLLRLQVPERRVAFPRARQQHVNFSAQLGLSFTQAPLVLHLKKMQLGFWLLGRGDGEVRER